MVTMGFRPQFTSTDSAGTTTLSLVKGSLTIADRKYWDVVTFGISGMDVEQYVSYVEVLDYKERLVDVIYDPDQLKSLAGVEWFKIDMGDYKMFKEFYLRVHILGGSGGPITVSKLAVAKQGAPIDPEETIIIVKFP